MFGYCGRVLRINLSDRKIFKEELPKEFLSYIGGTGLCAKYLFQELKPGISPLGEYNKIVMASGPLSATLLGSPGRFVIASKSPLTGLWSESHCGGFFGPELKYAGYDLLIIEGRSSDPVYILIKDEKVEIKSAKHIWGKNTDITTEIICETEDINEVACIGPAGEKLVKFAAIIINKSRAAARTGLGAVWGAKKLKSIGIKGSNDVIFYDNKKCFDLFNKTHNKLLRSRLSEEFSPLREKGTPILVEIANSIGRFPTKNHKFGTFGDVKKIGSETIKKKYRLKKHSCFGCKIQCKYVSHSGKHNLVGEGPEYESIVALGSGCLVNNLDDVIQANHLCNQYGLDTISCGNAISFAMECSEHGLIPEIINWGDGKIVLKLIKDITFRRGIGDLLAEGVKIASEKIGQGSESFAMHVKGMAIPGQDGRSHKSSGLTHATSVRGADHLRSLSVIDEIGLPKYARNRYGKEHYKVLLNRLSEEYKGRMVYDCEKFYAVVDSAIFCKTGTLFPLAFWWKDISKSLFYATGIDEFNDIDCLDRIGKRICVLRRAFNQREGSTRRDDNLPKRFLKEKIEDGPAKGEVCNLELMLNDYYALFGFDEDGLIKPETLDNLNLPEVKKDLYGD